MKPIEFPEANVTFAKEQEEYQDLPAWTGRSETISCWELSWRERLRLLWTGRLWLRQMNFGQPLQPQLPQIDTPFIDVVKDGEVKRALRSPDTKGES